MRERPAQATPDGDGTPEPTEALAALVEKLRAELAGVRTAMRNRAVIEQAKGVLVERLGLGPDDSFDQLVKISQRANIKLIEVAAAIVGTTAPDPQAPGMSDDELRQHVARTGARLRAEPGAPARLGAPGARTGTAPAATRGAKGPGAKAPGGKAQGAKAQGGKAAPAPAVVAAAAGRRVRPPAHEALQAQHQLITSRVTASHTFDEVADAVGATRASWPAPASVVLTRLEPDGAHLFVGAYGIGVQERSEWLRMPPQYDLPLVTAARDRTPILVADPETVAERYPAIGDRYDAGALFAAPLIDRDRVIGSLGVAWREPVDLDEDAYRYLLALAQP